MTAALVSLISALLCLAISALMLVAEVKAPPAFPWIRLPGFEISLGLKLDELSIGMTFVVTLVGTLVHIFSLSYMADDEGKGRYFAGLSLFMFSMTGIVLSGQLRDDVHLLGTGGLEFLSADRPLAYEEQRRRCGQEGLSDEPDRRFRIHDRHPHAVGADGVAGL